jgi:kynurenine formamidase
MKVVDLTMTISPSMKVFPGSPQPSFIPWSTFAADGYDLEVMHMSTHTGTHMDAPSHFAPGKDSIDRIPAARLVSNAILVKVPKGADEAIGADDIRGEDVREGDAVVFATGWEKHERDGGNYMTRNPGLDRDAAEYLAGKKVNAVAIDGPSIDPGLDSKFTAHNVLLPAGIIIIENLCNLDQIEGRRFTLVAAPLKLAGASGSPVRALALMTSFP